MYTFEFECGDTLQLFLECIDAKDFLPSDLERQSVEGQKNDYPSSSLTNKSLTIFKRADDQVKSLLVDDIRA